MAHFKSDLIDSVSTYSYIPTGGIVTIAGAFSEYSDPSYVTLGLIPCDGRSLNSSTNPQYAPLFSVIGILYGGTGSASFNVPNLIGNKISIAGSSNTFYNVNTVGTQVNSLGHSHSTTATNNSFSMNAGNTSHDHTLSYNDVGNMVSEGGHSHTGVSSSGTLNRGPSATSNNMTVNSYRNGPAGTAGGGLSGNHGHNVTLNANSLTGGGGNNHTHSTVKNHNTGYNAAISHTHGSSVANSANTSSSTYSSPSSLGVPYTNLLYFIKA